MDKLRVFISGTQDDMLAEREAVSRGVEATRLAKGIRAEATCPQPESPRKWILEQIRDSHIFIGVYSHRYGWPIPEENISATEFEFNEAQRLNKPILVWIRDLLQEEETYPNFERQKEFLKRVMDFSEGKFIDKFSNPAELEKSVIESLEPQITKQYEERYLEQVQHKCRFLYTEGVDQVTPELSQVFVMLEGTKTPAAELKTDLSPIEEPSNPVVVPLSDALREHSHLVILGDAGSGKTTVLQFISQCFASVDLARSEFELEERRMPVQVELRSFGAQGSIGELLVDAVARVGQFDPISKLKSTEIAELLMGEWLDHGELIILLDGLDEVPDANRTAVVESIMSFANTEEGRRCRVVVTSRIAGYRASQPLVDPFITYTIRPFEGVNEASDFAAGWLETLKGIESEEAKQQARALLDEMEHRQGLRPIMGNALLLRLAISVYVSSGELARNRADLYDRYVNKVIRSRERKYQAKNAIWSGKRPEQALEEIAWTLQTEDRRTARDLRDVFQTNGVSNEDSQAELDYLRERLALLATYEYENREYLDFRHSTFREFFVAQQLAREWRRKKEGTWKFLKPRLHQGSWREPILLFAGLLDNATELVERIAGAQSDYEQELHRDILLAGECIVNRATIRQEITDDILYKILQIYLDETKYDSISWSPADHVIAPEIETMFRNLGSEEQNYVVSVLEPMIPRTLPETIFSERVLAKVAHALEKRWGNEYYVPRILSIPVRLYHKKLEAKVLPKRMAFKALISFNFPHFDLAPIVRSAVGDRDLVDLAAEALARGNHPAPEDVSNLLDQFSHLAQEDSWWGRGLPKVIDALGILGQRFPEIVDLYLAYLQNTQTESDTESENAKLRNWLGQVLCKSAETNCRAMDYVLAAWNQQSDKAHDGVMSASEDFGTASSEIDTSKPIGITSSDLDTSKAFRTTSSKVVHYLIDLLKNQESEKGQAGYFLKLAMGNVPSTHCKVVDGNGNLNYETIDFTEDIFELFSEYLQNGRVGHGLAEPPLSLLVRWGLSNSNLLVRMIDTVQNADVGLSSAPFDYYLERSSKTSIDNWLSGLRPRSDELKCRIFYKAYLEASSIFYNTFENSNADNEVHLDPYTFAALTCFRAWQDDSPLFIASVDIMRKELSIGISQALSTLRNRDSKSLEYLVPLFHGQFQHFWNRDLEDSGKGKWLSGRETTSRQRFTCRIAACYALAKISSDYPQTQSILISSLEPDIWNDSEPKWPEDEVQRNLIQSLGYVQKPSRELVATLLEMNALGSIPGGRAYRALEVLQEPTDEAVSFLTSKFATLGPFEQEKVLKVFSKLDNLSLDVINVLVTNLESWDSEVLTSSAEALGNIKQPDSLPQETISTIVQSLAVNMKKTPDVADALVNLANRRTHIATTEWQALLNQNAKVLSQLYNEILHRGYPPSLGPNPHARIIAALRRIVDKLTEWEVRSLPPKISIESNKG